MTQALGRQSWAWLCAAALRSSHSHGGGTCGRKHSAVCAQKPGSHLHASSSPFLSLTSTHEQSPWSLPPSTSRIHPSPAPPSPQESTPASPLPELRRHLSLASFPPFLPAQSWRGLTSVGQAIHSSARILQWLPLLSAIGQGPFHVPVPGFLLNSSPLRLAPFTCSGQGLSCCFSDTLPSSAFK